ncbi:hypothetical protein GF323_02090 [Candidatus Woesearchaeota archaeon]|nr:hypothetical protein [Candidatus Woesearchaeota archaeon]
MDSRLARAEVAYQLGFHHGVRDILEDILKTDENNYRARILYGKSFRDRADKVRSKDSFFQKIRSVFGVPSMKKLTPDYDKAIEQLTKARDILESNDPRYGISENDRKEVLRDLYMHLGGAKKSNFEHNSSDLTDDAAIISIIENYHNAYLQDKKATYPQAVEIHSSLAFFYTILANRIRNNIGGVSMHVSANDKQLYEEALTLAKRPGWGPKIWAIENLSIAFKNNGNYAACCHELSNMHGKLAKYISEKNNFK